MKKEQIVDMIGEAPDNYVKDAKKYKKKRRVPRCEVDGRHCGGSCACDSGE